MKESSLAKTSLALRMDDVGASSKRYEVYSKARVKVKGFEVFNGNWLFFKYLPPWRAWGPYRELSASDWMAIFSLLESYEARLTVAVTAAWVGYKGDLTPYPNRFPEAAAALRAGVRRGLVEIANHGLTHCVLAEQAFRPRLMESNRKFHREFVDWIPAKFHQKQLAQSQEILQDYFEVKVETFVPPGNQFISDTLRYASQIGLKYVSCNAYIGEQSGMTLLGNRNTMAFHDREIVIHGLNWLQSKLDENTGADFVFVRDLAAN